MNNENMNGQTSRYNPETVPPVTPTPEPTQAPVYPQPQPQPQMPVEPVVSIPAVEAVPYQEPIQQPAPVMPDLSQPVASATELVYPQTPVTPSSAQPTPPITVPPVETPSTMPDVAPVMPGTSVTNPTPVAAEPPVEIIPTVETVSQPPIEPASSVPIPPTPQVTPVEPVTETTPLQTSLPPLDALPDHIDVNGNPSPMGPAPDTPPKRKKKSKLPVILLVIILLAASFLAGQYLANAGTFNIFKLFDKEEKKTEKKTNETQTAMATKIDTKQDYIYIANSYEIERDDTFKQAFSNSDSSFKIDTPYINIDNAEIKQLNEKFQKDTETLKGLITYHPKSYSNSEKYLATFTTSDVTTYQSNDIASLVIKNQSYSIPGDSGNTEYVAYNVDLKAGKILDNSAIFKKFKLEEDKIETIAKQKLSEQGIPVCDNQTETTCIDTTFHTDVVYVNEKGNVVTIVPLRSATAVLYQAIQLN